MFASRKTIRCASAVFLFLYGLVADAGNEDDTVNYREIDIYMYDWNASVRTSMKEVDVRARHGISITYTDDVAVNNLARFILFGKYEDILKGVPPDVRVVIDIVADNNDKHTFLMNKGYIFNKQLTLGKKAHPNLIDYIDNIMNIMETDLRSRESPPASR